MERVRAVTTIVPVAGAPLGGMIHRRQPFYDRFVRLDIGGREELVATTKLPAVLPSRQPPLADLIELARLRQAEKSYLGLALKNDYATDLFADQAFRRRLELQEVQQAREELRILDARKQYLSTLIRTEWARYDLPGGNPRTRMKIDEPRPAVPSFPVDNDRLAHRVDPPHDPMRPRIPMPVYSNPGVQNSGVQYFTGTQLDVLL